MASKSGKGKGQREQGKQAPAVHRDGMELYANLYIVGAVALSAGLNALSNGIHASATFRPFAWVLGVATPFGVLLLGKYAGLLYRRGKAPHAYLIGGISAVLLLLSVVHCAQSIALLTRSHWLLAVAMAVAIDAGLLGCEATSTLAASPKKAPPRKRKDKPAKEVAAAS